MVKNNVYTNNPFYYILGFWCDKTKQNKKKRKKRKKVTCHLVIHVERDLVCKRTLSAE